MTSSLLDLFEVNKKSDLEKLCRTLVISKREFASVVHRCELGQLLPYRHFIHHRELVPEQAALTAEHWSALGQLGSPEKQTAFRRADRRFTAFFAQRRILIGHMFLAEDRSKWHFFYFDQRDLSPDANHWAAGAHVHLINHLWPQRTPDTLWAEFTTGNPHMSGSLHIRFNDERCEDA